MIDTETLKKVQDVLQNLQRARRLMEDIIDIEQKSSEWQPGMGPKPMRMTQAEQWRYDMVDMQDAIERTYS